MKIDHAGKSRVSPATRADVSTGPPISAVTLSRQRAVRMQIAEIVEAECGLNPLRSKPRSLPRRAYTAALKRLVLDVAVWQAQAPDGGPVPDIKSFLFVSASRACWSQMDARDLRQARIRGQIRCSLALTPNFALWRSFGAHRKVPQWLGGLAEWREGRLPVIRLTTTAGAGVRIPRCASFGAIRTATLDIVRAAGGPVSVETLVAIVDALVGDDND
jgi:hypothetical protein